MGLGDVVNTAEAEAYNPAEEECAVTIERVRDCGRVEQALQILWQVNSGKFGADARIIAFSENAVDRIDVVLDDGVGR